MAKKRKSQIARLMEKEGVSKRAATKRCWTNASKAKAVAAKELKEFEHLTEVEQSEEAHLSQCRVG